MYPTSELATNSLRATVAQYITATRRAHGGAAHTIREEPLSSSERGETDKKGVKSNDDHLYSVAAFVADLVSTQGFPQPVTYSYHFFYPIQDRLNPDPKLNL